MILPSFSGEMSTESSHIDLSCEVLVVGVSDRAHDGRSSRDAVECLRHERTNE